MNSLPICLKFHWAFTGTYTVSILFTYASNCAKLFSLICLLIHSNIFWEIMSSLFFSKNVLCLLTCSPPTAEIILKWFYWISSITMINSFINWTKCLAQIIELGHPVGSTAPHSPFGKREFADVLWFGFFFFESQVAWVGLKLTM